MKIDIFMNITCFSYILQHIINMPLNINDLTASLTSSLNNVIQDTFQGLFDDVGNQFQNLNGFDFTQLQNNTVGSFDTLINDINTFTSGLVNDINNVLNQPMQDLLSVGSFITFLTSIKLILLDNMSKILGIRVSLELAKPLIKASVDMLRELYVLKDPILEIARIKFETKLQETLVRINLRKAKYQVRSSIEGFQRSTNLKIDIASFIGWPLILLSIVFFMSIYESRSSISKNATR